MALAPLPITRSKLFAGCARRVEATATTTLLVLDDGRRVAVAGLPDTLAAQRCRRGLNHIASVRIEGSLGQMTARVRGIGNRLPVDLALPVAAALALIDAGIPAVVSLTADAVTIDEVAG